MPENGRTHEPGLRELTTDVDGLREVFLAKLSALKEMMDERDRLYKERDESRRTAVDAALTAVKEQTKASFDASEKAIVKAEEAQKSYNQSHNDLARKMDDQNKATIPRTEAESRMRTLEEKINEIKNVVAVGGGASAATQIGKDETRANIAIALSFVGMLIALAMAVFRR